MRGRRSLLTSPRSRSVLAPQRPRYSSAPSSREPGPVRRAGSRRHPLPLLRDARDRIDAWVDHPFPPRPAPYAVAPSTGERSGNGTGSGSSTARRSVLPRCPVRREIPCRGCSATVWSRRLAEFNRISESGTGTRGVFAWHKAERDRRIASRLASLTCRGGSTPAARRGRGRRSPPRPSQPGGLERRPQERWRRHVAGAARGTPRARTFPAPAGFRPGRRPRACTPTRPWGSGRTRPARRR